MINRRPMAGTDLPVLQAALDQNTFHPNQKTEYYTGKKMYTEIYSDEQGPIGFLRYTKSLRLCTVWCDNGDRVRNGASIMQAIKNSVNIALADGFTEILFETNSPLLEKFCTSKLGFDRAEGNTLILTV